MKTIIAEDDSPYRRYAIESSSNSSDEYSEIEDKSRS